VNRERGTSGFYFASSDDLEGLVVSAKTLKELDDHVDEVIVKLYAMCGMKVVVSRLDATKPIAKADHVKQWVAMPAEIAQRALEKAAAIS
jgi:hypothetical protein